ncbi:MAG: hypothetical protein AAGH53_01870 [Pseudomonadota bacterium]
MTKMSKFFAGALALTALASHQTAWAQDCVATEEAEALMTVVMPGGITSLGQACQAHLPADAALLNATPYIENTLTPAAREAFPKAFEAIKTIAGDGLPDGLGYDDMAPLLDLFIGQELTKGIKPESCGPINTIIESIQAMTPAQASSMVVAMVQLASASDPKSFDDLPICPANVASAE